MSPALPPHLPWLKPAEPFPPIGEAWSANDPAPGLLAVGGTLDVATLCDAYSHSIFPWFNEGQPILWWSTDPRMVLAPSSFKLHRSLAKTLRQFQHDARCEVRFDTAFKDVIQACASSPRGHLKSANKSDGSTDDALAEDDESAASGTWIVPEMISAYEALHLAGYAHSVETWIEGELVGGLYCVALGHAVFGESMFSRQTNASKIALAGLVAFCRAHEVKLIDCQQNTPHLASLGAESISRSNFASHVARACTQPALSWHFENVYWEKLLTASKGDANVGRHTPPK